MGTSTSIKTKLLLSVILLVILYFCSIFLHSNSFRPRLRSGPEIKAPITSLLSPQLAFQIKEIQQEWALVEQGGLEGWILLDELPMGINQSFLKLKKRLQKSGPVGESILWGESVDQQIDQKEFFPAGSLSGLLNYAVEDQKKKKMMHHPSYRHRITSISSEWGRFYYRRTHQYNLRGMTCAQLYGDRVHLSLARRRIFYQDIFGSLWTDDFVKRIIDSNRGLLGVEALFGKGREYFLELSLQF